MAKTRTVKERRAEESSDTPSGRRISRRTEPIELLHPQIVRERVASWDRATRERHRTWRDFDEYAARTLEFDLSVARGWFEASEPQPSVYDGFTPMAKIYSHFVREHCGEFERPPRRECALARLLFSAYRSVARHRVGPDLELFWRLAEERERHDSAQYKELEEMATRLRTSTFADPHELNLEAIQLDRSLQRLAAVVENSGSEAALALKDTSFAPGRRPRSHERTILVNLEAELLESEFFSEAETLEGIRDLRPSLSKAKSGPLDRLQGRRASPAELVRVIVKPWTD